MKELLVIFVFWVMAGAVGAQEVMKFGYEETATPYSWNENGQMKGILIDIANEVIQKRMGIPVSHHGYPWIRAQHLVKKGVLDAHITNGPNRKEWAEHSSEAAILLEHLPYVGAKNQNLSKIRDAKSLEDLKPFKFVDNRGSGWAQKNLVEKGFNVHLVAEHNMIYRLLAKGRVDVTINMSHIARFYIKQLGLNDQIIELPAIIPPLPFHLVVGKKSPFTKIIPKFDQTIRQMKADGFLQKILDKYR